MLYKVCENAEKAQNCTCVYIEVYYAISGGGINISMLYDMSDGCT
ncbi:hypothetical protein KORDIASMS9_00307 [Kordia sp. SMS9]|nr:hypothetical protein KORDIASMS9_00307 [Kordia sp. SMS9]